MNTVFLAELIGAMLLAAGASLLFQPKMFMGVVTGIVENRSVLFMVGLVLYLGGVAIVLTHNNWSGGALTVAVTLIGWILILRGLASMFLPGRSMARIIEIFKVEKFAWAYGILVVVIGAYLIAAALAA